MPGTKSHHALSQSVADERQRVFEAILKARPTWDREKLAAYTADKRFSELVDLRLAVVTVACLDAKLKPTVFSLTALDADQNIG